MPYIHIKIVISNLLTIDLVYPNNAGTSALFFVDTSKYNMYIIIHAASVSPPGRLHFTSILINIYMYMYELTADHDASLRYCYAIGRGGGAGGGGDSHYSSHPY